MEIRYALTPIEEKPPIKRVTDLPPGILRKCTICGKEAIDEMDLEKFVKRPRDPHGRMNLCKDCHSANSRLKKKRVWK